MKPYDPSRIAAGSLLILTCLTACSRFSSAPGDVGDQQIALAPGESATVAGATVRLVAVEDSRCPTDVYCIWQGDVAMILQFAGAGAARTDTLRLNLTPKVATYGGLAFQATAVTPYPDTRVTAPTKTVTLRVTAAP